MKLEVLHELNDVFKDDIDPMMRQQVEYAKQSLRNDFRQLLQSGVSVMDLYKRFGAMVFKSDVLQRQQILETLSQGKEKQLVDLLNEDEKLVQRLNGLNNKVNQQFRQQLINGPLRVRPADQTLKQQYEKQLVLQQFAQGIQQYMQGGGGAPPGPPPQGGPNPGPGFGPGFGGGGAPGMPPGPPPPGPPRNPPRNPNQFNPGPQGGGGGIMMGGNRNRQQQLQQFQINQLAQDSDEDMQLPPPNADIVQQVMNQRQAQVPQLNEDVAMAMVNAIRQQPQKRDLRATSLRQPRHQIQQPIEEEKKRSDSNLVLQRNISNTRSRSRKDAGLDQPIIQQVSKRNQTNNRLQTTEFHEIVDNKSGFFLRSPDKPIQLQNVKNEVMENEEEVFNSPRNSPEIQQQLKSLNRQIRKDETSLRRPNQSRSRSENRKDQEFIAKVNEAQYQEQMRKYFDTLFQELSSPQHYHFDYKTENLLKQLQEPAGIINSDSFVEKLMARVRKMMISTNVIRGVQIREDLMEVNKNRYQEFLSNAYQDYKNGQFNRNRLSQLIVQITLDYFDDVLKQQESLNNPMRAAGEQQNQQPPNNDPDQQSVYAYEEEKKQETPEFTRKELIERNQNSEFKKYAKDLIKQKKYGTLLNDAANAYNDHRINIKLLTRIIVQLSKKYPNEKMRDEIKKLDKLQEEQIIDKMAALYPYLNQYFNEQEEKLSQIPQSTFDIQSSQPIQQMEISEQQMQIPEQNPEMDQAMQEEVKQGVQTRRGRSLLATNAGPPREKSNSQVRVATNKNEYNNVRQMMNEGNFPQAVEKILEGINNFVIQSQSSRNKNIQKPDYFFNTETKELQKIINDLLGSHADMETRNQLQQEYQQIGQPNKTLQYARNLVQFLEQIKQRIMQ